jgi:hypothetical protein
MKRYLPTAILAVLCAGCDPGYFYRPVNEAGVPMSRQEIEVRGVTVSLGEFETLSGSGSIAQQLTIRNNASVDVILLAGTFRSRQNSIAVQLPGDGELEWRTVPAGESKEVYCLVDLSEAGGNVEVALGTSLTWEWDVQIGDEKRTLQMKMVRAHY